METHLCSQNVFWRTRKGLDCESPHSWSLRLFDKAHCGLHVADLCVVHKQISVAVRSLSSS